MPLTSHGCVAAANFALQGHTRQARVTPTFPTAQCAPLAPTNQPQVQATPQHASCALLGVILLLPTPADVVILHQAGTAQLSMLLLGLSLVLEFWLLELVYWCSADAGAPLLTRNVLEKRQSLFQAMQRLA